MANKVEIIEYSKKVDFLNALTHAIGAVFGVVATVLMAAKAQTSRHIAAGVIFGLSIIAVYIVSAIYHGLPVGEAKRKARLLDHMTVPVLISGTATPCALITLCNVSMLHGISVLCLAWFCTVFGIFSKLFFFEKLKKVTMAVYIGSGIIMLASVIPIIDKINSDAFGYLVAGGIVYVAGSVLCSMGAKKECLHVVFHVMTLIGTAIHFSVIYTFVI